MDGIIEVSGQTTLNESAAQQLNGRLVTVSSYKKGYLSLSKVTGSGAPAALNMETGKMGTKELSPSARFFEQVGNGALVEIQRSDITVTTIPASKIPYVGCLLYTSILVTAAVVIVVAVILWYFVFRETEDLGEIMTDTVQLGSIQSMVEGSGMTKARNSASVTPGSGTILELYVQEGDQVTEGQQLYKMDDTTAREAVTAAQESVDNAQKDLQAVYDKIAELTVKAPHSGNLREVADLKVGDTVNEGDTIATIVNDTKLRLSLYYSYAYEGEIKVGPVSYTHLHLFHHSRSDRGGYLYGCCGRRWRRGPDQKRHSQAPGVHYRQAAGNGRDGGGAG